MYKLIFPCLAVALGSISPVMAQDESGLYTELDALYLISPGDFDSEQSMGITVGYELEPRHAVEFEIQVNGLDSDDPGFDVDADAISYLIGYKYDALVSEKYTVFLGAGAGFSKPEFYVSPTQQEEDSIGIAFARIGAKTEMSENFYFSGEVRYQHFEDPEAEGTKLDIGGVPIIGLSLGYSF